MSSIDGSYSEDFLGDGSSMVGRQRHSSTPISTGSSVEPDFPDDLSAIGDADDDSQSILSDKEWEDRIDWRAMLDTPSQRPSSPTSSVGASGILSDLVTEDGGYSAWSDGDSEEVRGADADVAAVSMDSGNPLMNDIVVGGSGVDFWSFKPQYTNGEDHTTVAPSAKRPRLAPGAGSGSGE